MSRIKLPGRSRPLATHPGFSPGLSLVRLPSVTVPRRARAAMKASLHRGFPLSALRADAKIAGLG